MEYGRMQNRSYTGPIVIGIVVLIVVGVIGSGYNSLVSLSQAVDAQWAQVQNVYQRRADLIPNLVATVKGAANFEKNTYEDVAKARASVGQIPPEVVQNALSNPQAFQQYAQAQDQLGAALTHLLAVSENYPQLRATTNFQTLQAQLEGTENRIAFERRKYNDAARAFNTRRDTIPTVLYAGLFGSRFNEKPYSKRSRGPRSHRRSTSTRRPRDARRSKPHRARDRAGRGRHHRSRRRTHRSRQECRRIRTRGARVRTNRSASARARERGAGPGRAERAQVRSDR
jgi:LemA protein